MKKQNGKMSGIPLFVLTSSVGLVLAVFFSLTNWAVYGETKINLFSFFRGMNFANLFGVDTVKFRPVMYTITVMAVLIIISFLLIFASLISYQKRIATVFTYVGFGCIAAISLLFMPIIVLINRLVNESIKSMIGNNLSSVFQLTAFPLLCMISAVVTILAFLMLQRKKAPTQHKFNGGSITCVSGMYRNVTFPVSKGEELVLGTDPKLAHIVISEATTYVSRKHCGIFFDSKLKKYLVIDYSSNGIQKQDGTKLPTGRPVELPCGTLIGLGNADNGFFLN